MRFALISPDYSAFKDLCGAILFNPVIRSAGFEDGFMVVVSLERNNLAEFADLIRNHKVDVAELSVA